MYVYFTSGSRSEPEGLTLHMNEYDNDGKLLSGRPKHLVYKYKEITEEEYNQLVEETESSQILGYAGGLLNEKGLEKLTNEREIAFAEIRKERDDRINLCAKKIKKELELGIIEESEIDAEIDLNQMSNFREEIKARLIEISA